VQSIRAAGVTAPIWFTEAGWEVGVADGGKFKKAASSTVSLELQAAYRVRLAVLAMTLGVERLHHMYVIDTDNYNGGFFSNGQPRPQASALTVQQRLISTATAVQTQVSGTRMSAHVLETPAGRVTVAWSDENAVYPADVPIGTQIIDMYGQVRGVTTTASEPVRLGPSPIYLVHAGNPAPTANGQSARQGVSPASGATSSTKPTATPKPTPTPSAKTTAKATPKPTVKPAAKVTAKAKPKPAPKPKPKAKAKPKAKHAPKPKRHTHKPKPKRRKR
jgi:hypothetical protein